MLEHDNIKVKAETCLKLLQHDNFKLKPKHVQKCLSTIILK